MGARASLPNKLPTIQTIRELAGLATVDAKSAVDRCLKGEAVAIVAPDADAAGQLIARLEALGWDAKRHYDRGAKAAADAG
jgi:hypothetical protein